VGQQLYNFLTSRWDKSLYGDEEKVTTTMPARVELTAYYEERKEEIRKKKEAKANASRRLSDQGSLGEDDGWGWEISEDTHEPHAV